MKGLFISIFKSIKNSIKRFPLTIGISMACVLILIYISEITPGANSDFIETLGRITMVLGLGIPLSLCIKLYFERRESYKYMSLYVSYIGGAMLLVLYYFFLLKEMAMVSVSRYTAVTLILYLIFIFVAHFPNSKDFEYYTIKIFTRFFTTVLYSLVLFLGLSAILFTIDELLGINIKSEIYYYTFLCISGIFAPGFLLAGVPIKNQVLSLEDYSRILKVLVVYIIMPLISIYTIILYIYFGKIIFTMKWPEGLVSNLVLWYSVISSLVLFFITPLLSENIWIRRYMSYFPKVNLPLIVMMFISIGIRINAYGVTENRYYVVALGIWVFLVMIYFAFTKTIKNIILPVSLVIITFVSVFGPFSSYSLSKYSQNKRLNQIFVENNMIKDNKVVKASTIVSDEDARNISSILNYFNRNHSLSNVKGVPQGFRIDQMETVLGIKQTEEYYGNENEYFSFNSIGSSDLIDIRGYDYFSGSRNNGKEIPQNMILGINFDYESSTLKIIDSEKEVYKINFQNFADKLIEKHGYNKGGKSFPQEEMTFEDENDYVKIKILFNNISGYKNSLNSTIGTNNFDFYVLVKVK